MHLKDLQVELSIKMLALEKAIDLGMPYPELKKIYNEIKELQYRLAFAGSELKRTVGQVDTDLVIE
jgi:hypothetical protein